MASKYDAWGETIVRRTLNEIAQRNAQERAERNRHAHERVAVNGAKSRIRNRQWDTEKGRRS